MYIYKCWWENVERKGELCGVFKGREEREGGDRGPGGCNYPNEHLIVKRGGIEFSPTGKMADFDWGLPSLTTGCPVFTGLPFVVTVW